MSNEEKRAKVHQILDLVMDINGLEARNPDANSGPTVFFYFEGHVGCVEVQIYNNGWNRKNNEDLSLEHSFRHDHYQSLEEVEQKLKEWIKEHESHE